MNDGIENKLVLQYDPIPWLMVQDGLPAVRARRVLGISHSSDSDYIQSLVDSFTSSQDANGSFENSLFKTAGILNCLCDLNSTFATRIINAGSEYIFSVLETQPGYTLARDIAPGSITTPCDLGGFFGPYVNRNEPAVMARGAREMNFFREYEPLMGPQSPVREAPRSSYDRAGPSSCYAWGLMPLSYTIETLCRAGYADDPRLGLAVDALLGVQRDSGGWCRNLGGHPLCTPYVVRVLGVHPELRKSDVARRALNFIKGKLKGKSVFTGIRAVAAFDMPVAREILHEELNKLLPMQQKNGTFGSPHPVERVTAVLVALQAVSE